MSKATVRTVPVADLVPDAGNVRRRDERAEGALEASLRQFGPARSVVIDSRDIVRAGNGTLEAFQAAGGTEVLVVEPEPGQLVAVKRKDWSRTEAIAYGIADNRLADLATYDDTGLADVLRGLESEQFDLTAVGFSGDEVDELCERIGSGLLGGAEPAPPDEFPEKDESIETEYCCPKCGYAWSGKSA